MTKQWTPENELDLLNEVVQACQAGIATALADPSTALGFAKRLQGSLDILSLVAGEREKGAVGNAQVQLNADSLVTSALNDIIGHASPGQGTPNVSTPPSQAAVGKVLPTPNPKRNGVPLFSEISRKYIEKRGAVVGKDNRDVQAHWVQRDLWLALIGDKPVDAYVPSDLQDFVIQLKHWPANRAKKAEFEGMTPHQILKANATLKYAPLALNTLKNKYVAFVKAMARDGMIEHRYNDPFAGVKLQYPNTAAAPVQREHLGAAVISKAFELGVKAGRIDLAILPALAYLSSRRIGLLVHLRGTDIRFREGVYVARVPNVQLVDGAHRVMPVKTGESTRTFVLHNFLAEIGFCQWAIERGDDWLFPQPHQYSDPSRYASQRLNRLLRSAGAAGDNIEVFHSLRYEAIDDLDELGVSDAQARIQSGHAPRDPHEGYKDHRPKRESQLAIANSPLDPGINWDVLRGLDFARLGRCK